MTTIVKLQVSAPEGLALNLRQYDSKEPTENRVIEDGEEVELCLYKGRTFQLDECPSVRPKTETPPPQKDEGVTGLAATGLAPAVDEKPAEEVGQSKYGTEIGPDGLTDWERDADAAADEARAKLAAENPDFHPIFDDAEADSDELFETLLDEVDDSDFVDND